ncbi:hypothetical protein F66182_2881, partial [Fusarium sp. NRRL 66182]
VKTHAKRALRDLLAFLAQFEYAPHLPTSIAKDFNDRVNLSAHGARNPRRSESTFSLEPHTTYSLSDLFAAMPPSDLPPYPTQEVTISDEQDQPPCLPQTCEWSTYHPLLTDALHSLLLCHCLIQTSAKELLRHTYMAARLVRLADGYPIFQASRSPARSDWVEVLRRADNSWLQLSASWETLCTPAPLPFFYDSLSSKVKPHVGPSQKEYADAAASLINGGPTNPTAEEEHRQRMREHDQVILDALDDERVCDEHTFRAAIVAREKRAERDRAVAAAANGTSSNNDPTTTNNNPGPKRWADEDDKEYPVCTARATAIAQWVLHAPVVTNTTRRKKRPKKAGAKVKEGPNGSIQKPSLENTAEPIDT